MLLNDIVKKLRGIAGASASGGRRTIDPDLVSRVTESGYFDAPWYCERYPDVLRVGVEPLDHYLRIGALLRRNPSEHFDTAYYLDTYPAVATAGANPLIDFVQNGMALGRKPRENSGKVALILHVTNGQAVESFSEFDRNFPADADRFLTYPDHLRPDAVQLLKQGFPSANLVPVPDFGQDAGALISLASRTNLSRYEAVCKVQCERASTDPITYLQPTLKAVLGSRSQVEDTIRAFSSDPRLMLASARQLYIQGPESLRNDAANLQRIFGDLIGGFDLREADWGFISGGCYWIRSTALERIKTALEPFALSPDLSVEPSSIIRSIEQAFGIVVSLKGGRIRLNDAEGTGEITVVGPTILSVASGRRSSDFTAPGDGSLENDLVLDQPPRGALDSTNSGGEIRGWLAVVGQSAPRTAVLRIDSQEFLAAASTYRADLKVHGINDGNHAFSLSIPAEYLDGRPHSVVLIDSETGREIARKSESWPKPVRDYWDFQGFLKSTMTMPVIHAPFLEEDKRAFAVMEGIANRMARQGLAIESPPRVSVIMPMYNRAVVVGDAIRSVLRQSYPNIELIIVDDGSVDESVAVVKSFSDPRIRLIELPGNRGVAAARNVALHAAEGDIICYLDTDNTWDERYVAAQVGAFHELPHADLIYSGVFLYRGEEANPYAVRYGHFHPALLENNNYIDNNVISHRRALLDRLGGFEEGLRRFVDFDLILRAAEVGQVVSVPMLLCDYFYQKVENSITADPSNVGYLDVVRERLMARQAHILSDRDKVELVRPVSVIIPNWESLEDIRDCLEALQARNWQGMLEVLVVDNGSSQPVIDYLKGEHDEGRITFIPLDRNFGFTYAVNVGIAKARSDSDLLLLNNDAIGQPGSIQALQQACLRLPDAGMVVPRQILPSGTKTMRVHVPFADERFACDVNISAHHRNVASVPVFHDGSGLELSYAAFFSVYIRRELLEAIGPLDAEYGRHYRSDRIYSDMMRNLTDFRMYYAPEAHFIHKLQKATDHLRDVGQRDNAFEIMFRRNLWDSRTAKELGYRNAKWDVF